jgi:hypothetical protein
MAEALFAALPADANGKKVDENAHFVAGERRRRLVENDDARATRQRATDAKIVKFDSVLINGSSYWPAAAPPTPVGAAPDLSRQDFPVPGPFAKTFAAPRRNKHDSIPFSIILAPFSPSLPA